MAPDESVYAKVKNCAPTTAGYELMALTSV